MTIDGQFFDMFVAPDGEELQIEEVKNENHS